MATGDGTNWEDALHRAMLALQGQRPQDAERIAKDLLKINARHVKALQVLGYALLMQGRPQDAVASLEPAGRGQHNAELETQLAIALRQVGRRDEALVLLNRVRPDVAIVDVSDAGAFVTSYLAPLRAARPSLPILLSTRQSGGFDRKRDRLPGSPA